MTIIRHTIFFLFLMLMSCSAGRKLPADENDLLRDVSNTLRPVILQQAEWAMAQQPVTVTTTVAERSAGARHDFYSEGDYWWPNPVSVDSPYIQKDGLTNPANFVAHRQAMIRFSRIVGALTSAYRLTGEKKYVEQAMKHCRAWFVDTSTLMNPSLLYAQAIRGRFTGRGIGIIDTIHLIEVAQSLLYLQKAGAVSEADVAVIKNWFEEYIHWLTTHKYGRDEMNAANNHGTCWVMQVAAFAKFTNDTAMLRFCSDRYKTVLLPNQMAADGSFPKELQRTKPYSYSLFNLDAMTMICQLLSDNKNDLWHYTTADGRSIQKGIAYMYPFVTDKTTWPLKPDVMYWEEWPVAQPFLLFGGKAFKNNQWIDEWKKRNHDPQIEEVVRNVPVRNPLIWL